MPITIKNSAGGGVTLDSTTSSNETLNLPSGGGTLAPLASPVFTGNVGVGTSSPQNLVQIEGSSGTVPSQLRLGVTSSGQYYDIGRDYTDGLMTFYSGQASPYSGYKWSVNAGTEAMRIDSSGNVLMGTTSSSFPSDGFQFLDSNVANFSRSSGPPININRAGSVGALVNIHKSGSVVGSISVTASSTAYNTSSDYRLKENVTPMSGATAQTKLLKPCNFDWIQDGSNVNGFLAHELADVVPEAVSGTKDAMRDEEYEVTAATDTEAAVMGTRSVPDLQGIDQSKLVPLLTATIQELITRIEALENV